MAGTDGSRTSANSSALLAVTLMALLGTAVAIISPCGPSITTRCPKTGGQYYAYCVRSARGGPGGGCRNVEKFGPFPEADCSEQCISPAADAFFDSVWVLDVDVGVETDLPRGPLSPGYNQLCVQSCKVFLTYPDLSIATGASAGLNVAVNGDQQNTQLDYWLDAAQSMPKSLDTCFQRHASLPKQCTNVRLPLPSCERKCDYALPVGQGGKDTVTASAYDFEQSQYSVDGTVQLVLYSTLKHELDFLNE